MVENGDFGSKAAVRTSANGLLEGWKAHGYCVRLLTVRSGLKPGVFRLPATGRDENAMTPCQTQAVRIVLDHMKTCDACLSKVVAIAMSRRGSRCLTTMTAAARKDRSRTAAAARRDSQAARRRREGIAAVKARARIDTQTTDTGRTGDLSPFAARLSARIAEEARRRAQATTDGPAD